MSYLRIFSELNRSEIVIKRKYKISIRLDPILFLFGWIRIIIYSYDWAGSRSKNGLSDRSRILDLVDY